MHNAEDVHGTNSTNNKLIVIGRGVKIEQRFAFLLLAKQRVLFT